MEPFAKERLLSFYNEHFHKHGARPEALHWSPQGQLKRFHTLLDIAPDLNHSRVLDYGCGLGDFYQFLKRRGISVKYTGTDINPNFIAFAKKKFPDGFFRVLDLDEDILEETFDYVFICGVFNLKVPGVQQSLENALIKLFKQCRKGLALNALSSHATTKDPDLNYTSPEHIIDFSIKNLSPSVVLRHDRIENDFTLFVYTSLNEIVL